MAGEVWADLVSQTAGTVTGTGSYTLGSAVLGGQTFASAIGTSGIVRYCARSVDASGNPDGNGYEIGQGTLSGSTTLARTAIKKSSNANAAVSWSAQTVYIWLVDDASLHDQWRDTCDLKLTLTSGSPIVISDVATASTIYLTPYVGNQITLYDTTRTQWVLYNTAEISLALSGLTANKNYDIFAYNNSGTVALELSAAWTNDSTRNDALTTQDGIKVKNSDKSRRYLGTFCTISTTATADAVYNRLVFDWTYYDLWKPCTGTSRVTYDGYVTNPNPSLGGGSFGDGSDGALVFDGSTTILGMVPSANVYTLTRDVWATDLTVNSGVTIITAGFRIFGTGTLTNSSGTIHNNGGNGGAGSSGAAGTAGAAGLTGQTWGASTGTSAGGPGIRLTTANSNGTAGSTTSLTTPSIGGRGGAGGRASSPGGGSSGSAGAGTATAPTAAQGWPRWAADAIAGSRYSLTASFGYSCGTGGNAGGVSQSTGTSSSGGGGGGGGPVVIAFRRVINNGTISANGGNGGNGFVSGAGDQAAAGGSGGGGGAVILVYSTYSGNAATANGGAVGTGATFGSGTLPLLPSVGSAGSVITIAA